VGKEEEGPWRERERERGSSEERGREAVAASGVVLLRAMRRIKIICFVLILFYCSKLI
jgi:hypothetical protein